MQVESSSQKMLTAIIVLLAATQAVNGQQLPNRVEDEPSGRAATSDDNSDGESITQELATLRESIARLESKIDRLANQPSEFSAVKVRVVDEQDTPQHGFQVKLVSAGNVQAANATGVSAQDGIGLRRNLPYGRYRMTVSGNGWHARDFVTVEVGKPLDLTVVAPTSDQLGELVLRSDLNPDRIGDLPFGEWEVKGSNGWGTRIVSLPQGGLEDLEDWQSFPTVSDGIEVVAVVVDIEIERRIKQSYGNPLTWKWRGSSTEDRQPHLKWLVQSDGTVRPLLRLTEKSRSIGRQAERFRNLAPEMPKPEAETDPPSHRERLGYRILQLGPPLEGNVGIQLPAGQVTLRTATVYGRPVPAISEMIDNGIADPGEQLWLRGVVPNEPNGWLARLLGPSWRKGLRGFSAVIEVAPEEQGTMVLGTHSSQ